jgi:hypothetical protein
MNKNYISHIAESKVDYHRSQAKLSYEEKVKIIIELQKIDAEMRKNNKKRSASDKLRMVWNINI